MRRKRRKTQKTPRTQQKTRNRRLRRIPRKSQKKLRNPPPAVVLRVRSRPRIHPKRTKPVLNLFGNQDSSRIYRAGVNCPEDEFAQDLMTYDHLAPSTHQVSICTEARHKSSCHHIGHDTGLRQHRVCGTSEVERDVSVLG